MMKWDINNNNINAAPINSTYQCTHIPASTNISYYNANNNDDEDDLSPFIQSILTPSCSTTNDHNFITTHPHGTQSPPFHYLNPNSSSDTSSVAC